MSDSAIHGADRPRVQYDADGKTLDDFMARDVAMVHFEALDEAQWYLTVELGDGQVWQLHFGAKNDRAKGYAYVEQVK
jgi:hypothetical protein